MGSYGQVKDSQTQQAEHVELGGVKTKRVLVSGWDGANINDAKVDSNGRVFTDGSEVTQPVSAASLPLPSGAATSANQQTDALTDTELRATPVPVSGTVAVTGTQTDGLTDTELRATAVPVSVASLPLPTGASTETTLAAINTALQSAGITQTQLASMVTALQLIDNMISGSEAQVDVVASLPAGTNAIGKLAANSGVDIGDVDVTSQPARDRTTDNIGVAHQTDKIMADTTALTPVHAAISTSAADNTIVAASAGNQIRVLSLFLVCDSDSTSIRFESGTGGTALTGVIPLKESTGFVLPYNPLGWFQTDTADDELLNLEITGTGDVFGSLTYVLVPD